MSRSGRSNEIAPQWSWTTLGEITEINPRRWDEEPIDTDLISFIPMAAVQEVSGEIDLSETREWNDVKRKSYTKFQDNDVLVAKITPSMENGKVAVARSLVGGRGIGSTEFHVLRPSPAVLPEFVFYFVLQESFRHEARAHMKGTSGHLRVPADFLKDAEFPLPPIEEQYRIVSEIEKQFTRLDAAVAALERARANLKRYRASVLAAACEGRLVPTEAELARQEGRDYETAAALLDRLLAERRARWEADELARMLARGKPPKNDAWKSKYKEPAAPDTTNLPELPEGWVVASVDQLTCHITSGSRDWSKYYGEGPGVFIMAQNVTPGRLDLSYKQLVNPPEYDQNRKRTQVEQGDLLVTIVGANTGDVCSVQTALPNHWVCQSVALMRPVRPELTPYLLAYLTSEENGQKQYARYIYGQGRPHLSFDQLRMTAVLLPPIAEQRRIVAEVERQLSVINELEQVVEANLQRAGRLRQSILKRAFEGRLVPQDPNDEPASVLLERIRAERDGVSNKGQRKLPIS